LGHIQQKRLSCKERGENPSATEYRSICSALEKSTMSVDQPWPKTQGHVYMPIVLPTCGGPGQTIQKKAVSPEEEKRRKKKERRRRGLVREANGKNEKTCGTPYNHRHGQKKSHREKTRRKEKAKTPQGQPGTRQKPAEKKTIANKTNKKHTTKNAKNGPPKRKHRWAG